MTRQEFEARTGFFPNATMYAAIEKHYMEFDGGKDEFCKAYKKNADGIAEKIQREVDMQQFKEHSQQAAEAAARVTEIEALKKRLEREQEWRPHEDSDNVQQGDYDRLRAAGDTHEMSDDEAKALLYDWFGFAIEKIKILRSIPAYEVNRHRQLRQVGEKDRRPLYNATDWNYIRFDCGCMSYELYNDNLRPFLH